jgi:hypothetical protein
MYVVIGEEKVSQIDEKYLVFELDTIRYDNKVEPVKTYCVIDTDHLTLDDTLHLEESKKLHSKLIENYQKRNWNYCTQAVDYLRGRFKGELDSFYDDLEHRCNLYSKNEPPQDWDGVYDKTK